jgi:PncC family amidohydrolase
MKNTLIEIGDDDASLLNKLAKILIEKQLKLAVAESCTGGMLGQMITSLSGSSEYFVGGVISYANEIKANLLNVSQQTLENYGAVSEETAKEMANGVLSLCNANASIAVTGIAGPGGGTIDKPVGTVCIATTFSNKTETKKYLFNGNREQVRLRSVYTAILQMLKQLM